MGLQWGAFVAWKATNTVRQGVREDGRAWKMENSGSKFPSSMWRVQKDELLRQAIERFGTAKGFVD